MEVKQGFSLEYVKFDRSVRNASRKACKTIGYVYLELRGEI